MVSRSMYWRPFECKQQQILRRFDPIQLFNGKQNLFLAVFDEKRDGYDLDSSELRSGTAIATIAACKFATGN
jgi:hypothetical protein